MLWPSTFSLGKWNFAASSITAIFLHVHRSLSKFLWWNLDCYWVFKIFESRNIISSSSISHRMISFLSFPNTQMLPISYEAFKSLLKCCYLLNTRIILFQSWRRTLRWQYNWQNVTLPFWVLRLREFIAAMKLQSIFSTST